MTRRIGLSSIRQLAFRMCKLIVAFTPLIKATFPDNETLLLALEAANTACGVLVSEIDAALPKGD